MSRLAASSEAGTEWSNLLRRLLNDLKTIHQIDQSIPTEAAFRDAIDTYLESEGYEGLSDIDFNFFTGRHGQILFIASNLDQALGLKTSLTLNEVFWTTAYAVLQAAFNRGFSFRDFRTVYKPLNSGLPKFSSDLPQFPRNVEVQKPLQNVFEAYIKCYQKLVEQLRDPAKDFDFEPVKEHIAQNQEIYISSEDDYRARFQEALEEQQSFVLHTSPGGAEDANPVFETIKELGRGSYGVVHEVREVGTGSVYARKSIPVAILPDLDEETIAGKVNNEVDIMAKLRHNHIASINIHFKGMQYWSIIMLPVADYDLKAFLEECTKREYPRNMMRMIDPWFGCLISALAYAHSLEIKHEDIKPQNILVKEGKVFLTDFGTAKDFSELGISTLSDFTNQGTPIYWPPEETKRGRKADVFALGCVFSEMLTVRQRHSLAEYRRYRRNDSAEYKFAYRSSLRTVRQWLNVEIGLPPPEKDHGRYVLEQILNMMIEDPEERKPALRVKRSLARETEAVFCDSCL